MFESVKPDDSRALRMAQFRQSVERIAPTPPALDRTRIMSAEEVSAMARETEQRTLDRALAEREGRAGLQESLRRASEKMERKGCEDGCQSCRKDMSGQEMSPPCAPLLHAAIDDAVASSTTPVELKQKLHAEVDRIVGQ